MHTSLTILVILTVVILIVILMTSPTCKSAVGAILGQKKVSVSPKTIQPPKPKVESLKKPSNASMVAASRVLKPENKVQHTKAEPVTVTFDKPEVKTTSFPVLNGNVLDMFNSTVNVESEFGLTEEQIDSLAKDFKETHLDVKKDEVTRHRSIVRSQLEEADGKLREGYQNHITSGKKPNTEDAIIQMREERLMSEGGKKSGAKLTIGPRK